MRLPAEGQGAAHSCSKLPVSGVDGAVVMQLFYAGGGEVNRHASNARSPAGPFRDRDDGEAAGGTSYFAFISYSHADRRWADWLHRALETYRVPRRLVGQRTPAGTIPRRLIPIFRDREELASATDLARTVNAAIAQSANLIVICSPSSATSRWVDDEVSAFKRLGRGERIFCLIVDGEPHASDLSGRSAEECLAPALRFAADADGARGSERVDPIAADVRPQGDGKTNAKLKLVAGLLDVGFDMLKQRELQRRNRRLAMITAAALLAMVVTTALTVVAMVARNAAEVARQAAERRQKQAEELVGFMLGDLNDKLAQVSRLDIMEAVDDKAMAYFRAQPTADVTDAALTQRAKALEKIGVVRQEQGHLAAAMESFAAAAELAGTLADAAPLDARRQIAYSRSLAFVGMTHWSLGELDGAQASFESAQRVLQRARPEEENRRELLFQLTLVDNNIGHALEARGKIDQAEVQYRSMLTHCEQLVAGGDAKPRWRSQLGSAHNNLGQVALLRGDLLTAVAEYAADKAIETALVGHDPKNNSQRANAMRVRAIYGRTLALTGAVDEGISELRAAVGISAQLLEVDPNQAEFQEYAALYSSQLSRLLRLSGDLRGAAALNARSLEVFAALTRQDPANSVWNREFAEARTEQAVQSLLGGQREAALQHVRAALKILDAQLAEHPDDHGTLLDSATARLALADAADDTALARQSRDAVIRTLRTSAGAGGDPRMLALQVAALLGSDRRDEAKPLLRQLWASGYRDAELTALLLREHVDYPVNVEFRQRLQAELANETQGSGQM